MKFARNGSLSILALMFLHALVPGFLHAQPQRTVGRPRQQASFQPAPNAPKYAPDRVLVRFRPETPKPRAQAAHAAIAAQVIRSSRLVRGLDVVRLPEKMTVGEALSAYRRDPTVLYAEPDYVVHVEQNPVTPNDPGYPQLWGLHNTGQTGGTPGADIHAPQAWSLSTGSPNVVVGVIDTGIDYNHEDLNVNMFRNPLDCNSNGVDDDGNGFIDDCYGIDTFNGDSDPMDDFFHGTHVAGTIGAAGNNGIGVIGVNWQVKLLACKFIGSNGWGYTSGAITCLDYMATMKERGVNIVATNNSWGGDAFSQALYDAIDVQRQKGILFIAAAGNAASDNDGAPMFPAGYYLPNIIAVAATDDSDSPALFSNFGGHSVHLGAPGVGILSTTPGNTYTIYSGTSMAAPHVTGAAALLAAQDPSRDWKTVRNLILAGGDAIPAMTNTISQKRLNVRGAMTCTNSTVLSRLQPRTTIATAAVGLAVDLAVLHINCGRPNGDFTVSLDGGIETIPLRDDGGGADQEANDGIYSAQWTPSATGSHTLAFPGGDVVTLQVLTPYRYSTTTFTWRTIAGTPLNLDDTERSGDSVLVSPPFPIQFGGGSFDRLYVNSNGNITFTAPFPSAVVEPIPSASTATLVAPFWDDLVLFPYSQSGPPADAYWEVVGAAPNRELVIEWRDVSRVDPSAVVGILPCEGRITFQVVFFEGRSDILFNYADVHFADPCVNVSLGRLASVGVQVTPRVGTQFSYQSPSLSDGFAVLWQMGNSAPAITQLSPFTALTTDTGVSVKVLGSNFVPEATVRWNGADLPTTFVNSSELRADVSTSKLSTPGRVQLSVNNPGGGLSNSLPFDVYSSHPVPTLGSIPELGSIHAGDPGPKTLTASGSQFVTNSVLRWNGNDRPTTTFDSTRLTAEIPASDYAVAGTYEVTVFNPGPGGGTSNALTIQLNNPLPRLYGIWPDFAPVGGPDFTMAVFSAAGGTFNSASIVRWNGSDRPTTFVSRDILEAAIPASDIASVGTAKVTVFNPAPGGGTSNEVTFDIVAHPPNDSFANAIEAQPIPFTYVVDDRGATTEPSDPAPSCDYDEDGNTSQKATVWYKYTPSRNIDLFARADRANNTDFVIWEVLSVWVGTPGALVEHACGWSMWESVTTDVGFTASAGTTYYFMLSLMQHHNEQGPDLRFSLREADPVPTLDSLSPSSALAGGPAFTLTINGSNFLPSSYVMWDGPPYGAYGLGGTYVSSTRLTVPISANLLAQAGTGKITVVNPYSVGGVSNALPFVINPAPSVQFALTVIHSSNGTGTGTVTSNPAGIDCGATCSASFASGTLVTLTATPTTGSSFAGWDGDCRGSACILTMDGTKNVWATFIAGVSLTVTRAGSGTGTVTSNPAGIDCGATCSASFASGAVVDLTATPATGSTFVGWSGDCSGGVCIMEGPKKVTATFDTAPPPFNFGPPPAPRTVSAGQSAQFPLELTGQAGFTGTVSFSCTSSVPQGVACSFSPASVSPGSGTATTTLTVTTTARTSAALITSSETAFAYLMAPLGLILVKRRKSLRQGLLVVGFAVVLALTGWIVACGGGSGGGQQPGVNPNGTPPGTYTITVTGTSSNPSSTQSVAVTLTVN